jgi:SAM domain (Sterile alpha motif)
LLFIKRVSFGFARSRLRFINVHQPRRITDWLRGLGLERYAATFRDNDIDDAVLQRLTAEDLRELGIASVGHRRRLLDAIAALALTPAVNTSGLPAAK